MKLLFTVDRLSNNHGLLTSLASGLRRTNLIG